MGPSDWITAGLAMVGLVMSVVAVAQTRKANGIAAAARDAAGKSNELADYANALSQRANDSAQEANDIARRSLVLSQDTSTVKWECVNGPDGFPTGLRNVGPDAAHDVSLTVAVDERVLPIQPIVAEVPALGTVGLGLDAERDGYLTEVREQMTILPLDGFRTASVGLPIRIRIWVRASTASGKSGADEFDYRMVYQAIRMVDEVRVQKLDEQVG